MVITGRLAQTLLDYAMSVAKRNWAQKVEPIHLLVAVRRWNETEFDSNFPGVFEQLESLLARSKGTAIRPENVDESVTKLLSNLRDESQLQELTSTLLDLTSDRMVSDVARATEQEESEERNSITDSKVQPLASASEQSVSKASGDLVLERGIASRIAAILSEPEEKIVDRIASEARVIGLRVLGTDSPELVSAVERKLGVCGRKPRGENFTSNMKRLLREDSTEASRVATSLAIVFVDLAEFAASLDSVVTESEIDAIDTIRRECRDVLGGRLNATTDAIEEFEKKFSELIGMEDVKNDLRKRVEFMLVNKRRASRGQIVENHRMHMAFVGNPGTGKTTVARLFAQMLQSLGLLPSDKFIETDRSGLVGSFVGETEKKTAEVIGQADGGVLFIDEAYALFDGFQKGKGFGEEAINVLVKRMEDSKDRLLVIFAGYKEQMDSFFTVNPGLKSRVPSVVEFADYSVDELLEIGNAVANRRGLSFAPEAIDSLTESFNRIRNQVGFGNAREVENVIDIAQRNLTARVAPLGNLATSSEMNTILASDLPEVAIFESESSKNTIGFR